MSEIRTVEDIRRSSGWREALEERQNYEHERRKRELDADRERKAREVQARQRAVTADWYDKVGSRVRDHFRDWAWAAIDDRIREHFKSHDDMYNDVVGEVIGVTRANLRKDFEAELGKLREEFRVGVGRLPIA